MNWLDEIFERDWQAYIKGVREENRDSNYRLLRRIHRIKGTKYLDVVKRILRRTGTDCRIKFSNKAVGVVFRQPEWEGIGDVYIDQRSFPQGGVVTDIYIPLRENKYLWITKHQ